MMRLLQSRRGVLYFALTAVMLFGGCKKDDADDPSVNVTTGFINGLIDPADAVTAITATDNAGHTSTATPDAGGYFLMRNVVPGTYSVQFTPKAGYVRPAVRAASLGVGDTARLGYIAVYAGTGATGGTASCRLDSYPFEAERVQGSLVAGLLTIQLIRNTSIQDRIYLQLDGVTGPGTYSLLGSPNEGYYQLDIPNYRWSTRGPNNQGSVQITQFDSQARLVSGTFSFNAHIVPGFTVQNQTVSVTNGTFTDVPF